MAEEINDNNINNTKFISRKASHKLIPFPSLPFPSLHATSRSPWIVLTIAFHTTDQRLRWLKVRELAQLKRSRSMNEKKKCFA